MKNSTKNDKKDFLEKISQESGIPKDEIAGVYTDNEKGERLVFKRDQIINQFQRIVPEINTSFDKVYNIELTKMSSDLSETMSLIFIGYKQATKDKNELLITSGNILRNSLNTITSSIHNLRSGFRLQSGILLRSVIEMCATVTHLIIDPTILSDFKKDKLKSTNSITIANKQVPLYGKAWGLLSKKQIHINSMHADWYPLTKFIDKKDIPSEVTLGIIGLTILIFRITTELVFLDSIEELKYWKREEHNKVTFIPPNDKDIKWIKVKLKEKTPNRT